MEDYIKHIADLEEQLVAVKNAPKPPPEEPMNSDRFTQKVRELEEALVHARQERSDVARDYARRAIELEQQVLRAQQDCAEYARRCKELEHQMDKFDKLSARDDASTYSSMTTRSSASGMEDNNTQDVMKLIEEVETLNAEKRLQRQEMEDALRSKAELAKTVESLKQETLIRSQQQKPQSAIQALIDKTHRYLTT